MAQLLIQNANILDVISGTYREATVAVEDGVIADTDASASSGAETVINASGKYLLPGFIDAHVHATAVNADLSTIRMLPSSYVAVGAARILKGMLSRGFTTVRDTGGADWGLAKAQEEGLIKGPRLVYGGRAMSQTGGHGDRRPRGSNEYETHPCCAGTSHIVDGVENVRRVARDEFRRGASHLKMHASGGVSSPTDGVDEAQYSVEEIRAAVQEAENVGAYVTVHAYPPRAIIRALEAGVRCVEHGNLLDDETIEIMRKHSAFLVPTISTYWAMHHKGLNHGLPKENWDKVGQVLQSATSALERAARAGIKIAFGTDLLGSMHQYQNEEFRIRAEVQTPLEIIQSATIVGAELLQDARLGTVADGAYGDLLLYEEDPLNDISVLADPQKYLSQVFQAGRPVQM